MMRRLAILLGILFFNLLIGRAEVVVQCRVSSPPPVWQGQRVIVEVDALIAEGWVGIKKINLGDVDGAVVLNRNPAGITISEQVNGQSCSGQRKELWIYPQRGGKMVLPAFTVDVESRTWGAGAETETQRIEVASRSFKAEVPAGAPAGVASAIALRVSQQWTSDLSEGIVGDAVVRTLIITADDLPGMLLPSLQMNEQAGIGLYRKQPFLDDQMERGELVGKREEIVTYVFEAPGTYRIPTLFFEWFDLKSATMKTELFEGRTVVIAGSAVEPALEAKRTTKGWWLFAILLGFAGCLPLGQRIYARVSKSEWGMFWQVRRSARLGSKALLNATLKWGDQLEPDFRIDSFLQQYGEAAAYAQLESFYRAVGTGEPDCCAGFIGMMAAARRRYFKLKKEVGRERRLLPKLNP